MNHTKQQDGRLYKTSEVLTPGLHQGIMNKYENKDGRVVVMHQNKTKVTTADGTEWTRVDSKIIVPAAKLPNEQGPAVLPKSTVEPGSQSAPKPTIVPATK